MSNNIVTQATTRVNVDGKQAEQELEALRKKAEQFKKQMFEAYNKGDQKGLEKARKELIAIEKEMGKVIRSSVDINKTLNNLSTTGYDDLKKTLVALNKEINKSYIRRGSEEYNNLARSMGQVRAEMARVRSEQGLLNNSNSSSKWINSMQVFVGGMMIKAVALLGRALTDGVNKIRSFEKANVMLGSILGANKEQMKDLSASAIDLAKTSIYTASQVTDLQTELAKLGFTPNQIKDSQKHVLNLATALDAQLGPSAELVGATLKAFNADTKETEKYVDAMTEAANRSAIGFEYLATAMPIVAPVAKAFNFSLEDTLALLGNLSDSGFDASSASTALRNILLNLANSNGKLAIALGRPVKTLPDLIAGFKDLKEKGIDLATSLELTDARSVAAFQTFLSGADSILELRDSIEEAGGAADKMAKDQMDNLDGAVRGLESSWEALMLSFSNSSGFMKKTIDFASSFIDVLTNLVTETKISNKAFDDQVEKVVDLEANLYPLAKRYDELKTKTTLNVDEQAELSQIISTVSGQIPGIVTEFDKYGNILSINTQKVYEYINAERARLNFVNKETIASLKEQKAKLQKEYDEQYYISQHGRTIYQTGSTFSSGESYIDDRATTLDHAAKKVVEIGRDLEGIDAELDRLTGKSVEDHLTLQKKLIEYRQKFTAMNALELKSWIDDENNAKSDFLKIAQEIYSSKVSTNTPTPTGTDRPDFNSVNERQKMNNALRSIEYEHQEEMLKLKQEYLDNDQMTEEEFNDKKLKLQDDFDNKKKQRLIKFSKTITDPSMQLELAKQIVDIDSQALDKKIADWEKKQKDAYLKEQELLKWNEEETKLVVMSALNYVANEESKEYMEMMQRRANNLISEEAYQKEMTKIQTKYLEERLKINGLTDEQIAEMRIRILEEEINTLDSVENQRTRLLGYQIKEQMEDIDEALESGAITFGEAVMLRMEAYVGAFNTFVSQVGGTMDNFTSAEESAISRKYDREIALAKNNSKKQRKLEEEKQKEIAATKAKYADKQFAISVAQVTSSTAVAAMEAYKAAMTLGPVGFVLGPIMAAAAIAYGASQISVAKEQRNAAKSNYWTGGYTPNGPKYGYAGNVHFGEFVANQRTRQNPTADAVLSVIDIAQKNNTESSLTAQDFITGLDYRERMSGTRRTDTTSTPAPLDDNPSNDLLIGVTMRMTDTIDKLEQRLDNLTAKVYFKGEGGIEEVTKKANRLDKNVSRNG